jgi:Fur family ferric uptake transcriptional regulator
MTLAPLRQSKSFRGVAEVIDALREAGHRVSAPARHVLEALFAAEGPLSAERIAAGVEETSTMLEITSVYRNLERLEQLGVVSHVHIGHGPGRYALARDGDREYLVCDRCGRVTSLKPEALEPIRKTLLQAYGHHARFSHFAIHGHCEPCMRALASNAEQPGTGRAVDSDAHGERPHLHSHGDHVHSHPHRHGEGAEHGHDHR